MRPLTADLSLPDPRHEPNPPRKGRPLRGLCAVSLLACASCADALAWGAHELDARPLAESPRFQHLADALEGEFSLQSLWDAGESLPFERAPDPTGLLQEMARSDDERSTQGGVPLRVLTFNVGLLDAKVFGFIDYARTPLLEERRFDLPDLVADRDFDVVFLQEVWLEEDLNRFQAAAERGGYAAFFTARREYNDGLMMWVRRTLIADERGVTQGGGPYSLQNGSEHFPGPGIKRGYQWARFEHADLGFITLFNTHMQAYPENWRNRIAQARELGLAVRELSEDDDLALVAGDLNSGPYYRADEWEMPSGNTVTGWWENAIAYPVLLEYGDLVDLAVAGRPLDDAASDVTLGDRVVNDPALSTEFPGATRDFCEVTPHSTFSASDCNSLYFLQYAGTEAPARLDHLHARDPRGRVRVVATQLEFTEKLPFGDTDTEPSDHYGVSASLHIDGAE